MSKTTDANIWVETKVSSRTHEPFVVLRWYDHSGELTPGEARAFALNVLAAAEAAEGDAFVVNFFAEKIGTDDERAALILHEFRQYRDEQEAKS